MLFLGGGILARKKKCKSGNHTLPKEQVLVKYCPDCGMVVNPEARVLKNCGQFHYEKAINGYNYCPDCGKKL